MPRAGEIMSMRGFGMPRTPGQGAVRRAMMQQAITPMVGGKRTPRSGKPVQVAPLAQRMSAAYERLESAKNEESDKLSPKTAVALGKLVLEFEQVNASLGQLRQQIGQQSRVQKQIGAEEKKLLKKEEDSLVSVRASFLDIRAKLGLFAGALAIKSALEGRPGDAAVNAGAAVTAFLPEIINIVTGAVMGKVLLGGGKPGGAPRMPRGGGKLGIGLGLLALLGMGGMAMNQSGTSAEQRRADLIRQQKGNTITPEDTKRFGSLSVRFDKILAGMLEFQDPKKPNMKTPKGEDTSSGDGGDGGDGGGNDGGGGGNDGISLNSQEEARIAAALVTEGAGGTAATDVLQVVANRAQKQGKSYTDILAAPNQFQGVFKRGIDKFRNINSIADAAKFAGVDEATIKRYIADIRNENLRADSAKFVGGALEFRGSPRTVRSVNSDSNPYNNIEEIGTTGIIPDSIHRGGVGDNQFLTGPQDPRIKAPAKVFYRNLQGNESRGDEVSIIPVQSSSANPQQPIASAAAGPTSITPDINPDYNDVGRIIQALNYSTEAVA